MKIAVKELAGGGKGPPEAKKAFASEVNLMNKV